ncbi:extracellular solute-binding protein [Clostridium tarantellae]|uniref:Extracellular solute-binding protein n=1 Tax=Clostridium tarantellae TaxID=39493 RepID=A0A6I1MTL8_9CLOT|nr:extracellular solute-binding protein [Clostridium tarantellae]MPQ44221.1 extracellular solute-binding protein [Clostridium tarantellae]
MIKKFFVSIILIILVFGLVSCDNNIVEKNKILEDELLVYTTYSDDVMKYITEQFKKETGITIDYKIINSNIIENLKDSNPDVILGGDMQIYKNLKINNKLLPYKTSWFNKTSDENRGIDGSWYTTLKEPIVLFYNSKYITATNAPKSWMDLSNKIYKDKIIMENINEPYIKNIILNLMYQFEKDNKEAEGIIFLQQLKNNIYKFEESSEDLFKEIQNKETTIGISKLSTYLKEKNDNNIPLVEVDTTDGAIFETEAVAILKNSLHPNTAKLFLEFVAGPKMQLEIAKKFNKIPTNEESLKYISQDIINIKPMEVDLNIINKNEEKWMGYFNNFEKEKTINNSIIEQTNKNINNKNCYSVIRYIFSIS